MRRQQCSPSVTTVDQSVGAGACDVGADVAASNGAQGCAASGADVVRVRAHLVADAITTVPALCDVDEELLSAVEEAVGAAAGAAFDAVLVIAVREDPVGECPVDGEAEVSDAALADAQQRYADGPGVAVGRFAEVLANTPGTSGPDGCPYSDEQVRAALEAYASLTSRSLTAYGIQTNPNVVLATAHSSGIGDDATASDNIQDVVEGNDVDRSAYGNAPGGDVALSDEVLTALATLGGEFSFKVSELAGGSHSRGSRHYAGVAIDVSQIDGAVANSRNRSVRPFMDRCEALGATEVLGPGDDGHDTHVHAAWPRP